MVSEFMLHLARSHAFVQGRRGAAGDAGSAPVDSDLPAEHGRHKQRLMMLSLLALIARRFHSQLRPCCWILLQTS